MKDVKEIDSRRSVHFDETELQEVLTFCLQGLPLDFRIYNQTIIITKKNTVPIPAMRTIKGVIRDEDGITLPSATILVKGSNRGTISTKTDNSLPFRKEKTRYSSRVTWAKRPVTPRSREMILTRLS